MSAQEANRTKQIIEAILFASNEPISLKDFKTVTQEKEDVIKNLILELKTEYEDSGKSFELLEIAGGYQIFIKREFFEHIAKLRKGREEYKLSAPALETLAIIAYKQPISKAIIESIRGVQSDHIIRGLLDKGLIKIAGRESAPGKPLLYGTTDKFLQLLGINSIQDLPKPEELAKTNK